LPSARSAPLDQPVSVPARVRAMLAGVPMLTGSGQSLGVCGACALQTQATRRGVGQVGSCGICPSYTRTSNVARDGVRCQLGFASVGGSGGYAAAYAQRALGRYGVPAREAESGGLFIVYVAEPVLPVRVADGFIGSARRTEAKVAA
jgi:hypothetical protein